MAVWIIRGSDFTCPVKFNFSFQVSQMIESPTSSEMRQLCDQLSLMTPSAGAESSADAWPGEKLRLCAEAGVYRWFVPAEAGGLGWSEADIARGYLQLSAACLTTTFILTQQVSALRRVAGTPNEYLRREVLPQLVSGNSTSTVAISHLTTSRRHLGKPVLHAEATEGGFVIDGYSPWCTGGCGADWLVMGAEQDDGGQVLFAVDKTLPGVVVEPGNQLMALSASQTGAIKCGKVFIEAKFVIAGPKQAVLSSGKGGGTGGLQTSTLAIGLAAAAVEFIHNESQRREDLRSTSDALQQQLTDLTNSLLALAGGTAPETVGCSAQQLRAAANSFVLRATQAALVAAKGGGYVQGHPVERWCREAMFFLVWSCPQPVLQSNLCEFAGIES
jgi:alkylation response protein AidB-like acyl-CoA dehydrogenase